MSNVIRPYSMTELTQFNRTLKYLDNSYIDGSYTKNTFNHSEVTDYILKHLAEFRYFSNCVEDFVIYFEGKRNILSEYRESRFGRVNNNLTNIKYPTDLLKDLEYIKTFLTTTGYLKHISIMLTYNPLLELQEDTYKKSYQDVLPEGFYYMFDSIDGTSAKIENVTITNKLIPIFLKLYPLTFYLQVTKKAPTEDNKKTVTDSKTTSDTVTTTDINNQTPVITTDKNSKHKVNIRTTKKDDIVYNFSSKLPALYFFVQDYRDDIYKITFAIRANHCIDMRNEQISLYNKTNNKSIPKITKTILTAKSGLDKSTTSNYFIGKSLPSTDFLLLLSNEFDVPIDYLINPAVKVGKLKQAIDETNYEPFELSQESSLILRFLCNNWAFTSDVRNDQASLITTTLDYLIRDIFADYIGDAKIPTLEDPVEISLCKSNENFHDLLKRAQQGSLRLNKESVLYLLGRYLFDHYLSNRKIPNELQGANLSVVDNDHLNFLYQTLKDNQDNPTYYKKTIAQFLESVSKVYENPFWDDKTEDISQYILESLLSKMRVVLTEHQNTLKEGRPDTNFPRFDPLIFRGDYDETKEQSYKEEEALGKSKDFNGFSLRYKPTHIFTGSTHIEEEKPINKDSEEEDT